MIHLVYRRQRSIAWQRPQHELLVHRVENNLHRRDRCALQRIQCRGEIVLHRERNDAHRACLHREVALTSLPFRSGLLRKKNHI